MPSYQYVWSAGSTPIGTVQIQISNDYKQNVDGSVRNAGNWTAIYFQLNGGGTLVNSAPISGNSGTGFIDVPIVGAYAIRTVYTRSSGSGTMTVTIAAKVT